MHISIPYLLAAVLATSSSFAEAATPSSALSLVPLASGKATHVSKNAPFAENPVTVAYPILVEGETPGILIVSKPPVSPARAIWFDENEEVTPWSNQHTLALSSSNVLYVSQGNPSKLFYANLDDSEREIELESIHNLILERLGNEEIEDAEIRDIQPGRAGSVLVHLEFQVSGEDHEAILEVEAGTEDLDVTIHLNEKSQPSPADLFVLPNGNFCLTYFKYVSSEASFSVRCKTPKGEWKQIAEEIKEALPIGPLAPGRALFVSKSGKWNLYDSDKDEMVWNWTPPEGSENNEWSRPQAHPRNAVVTATSDDGHVVSIQFSSTGTDPEFRIFQFRDEFLATSDVHVFPNGNLLLNTERSYTFIPLDGRPTRSIDLDPWHSIRSIELLTDNRSALIYANRDASSAEILLIDFGDDSNGETTIPIILDRISSKHIRSGLLNSITPIHSILTATSRDYIIGNAEVYGEVLEVDLNSLSELRLRNLQSAALADVESAASAIRIREDPRGKIIVFPPKSESSLHVKIKEMGKSPNSNEINNEESDSKPADSSATPNLPPWTHLHSVASNQTATCEPLLRDDRILVNYDGSRLYLRAVIATNEGPRITTLSEHLVHAPVLHPSECPTLALNGRDILMTEGTGKILRISFHKGHWNTFLIESRPNQILSGIHEASKDTYVFSGRVGNQEGLFTVDSGKTLRKLLPVSLPSIVRASDGHLVGIGKYHFALVSPFGTLTLAKQTTFPLHPQTFTELQDSTLLVFAGVDYRPDPEHGKVGFVPKKRLRITPDHQVLEEDVPGVPFIALTQTQSGKWITDADDQTGISYYDPNTGRSNHEVHIPNYFTGNEESLLPTRIQSIQVNGTEVLAIAYYNLSRNAGQVALVDINGPLSQERRPPTRILDVPGQIGVGSGGTFWMEEHGVLLTTGAETSLWKPGPI